MFVVERTEFDKFRSEKKIDSKLYRASKEGNSLGKWTVKCASFDGDVKKITLRKGIKYGIIFIIKDDRKIISYGGIFMKKILTVVAIIAWIISVFTAVVLVCLYMKDILKYLGILKEKFANKCHWFRKAEDIFAE